MKIGGSCHHNQGRRNPPSSVAAFLYMLLVSPCLSCGSMVDVHPTIGPSSLDKLLDKKVTRGAEFDMAAEDEIVEAVEGR